MGIALSAKLDSSFDDPLGLLTDCHRRIERFLEQALRVAEQVQGGPLREGQHGALAGSLRYFREAAPLHTQDEEQSLFPRLRASERCRPLLERVESLEVDHRRADEAHAEVDRLGRRWLSEGALSAEEVGRLVNLLRGLRETYRAHIATEDQEVLPAAGELLDPGSLAEVGREMARRRGLDPDRLPMCGFAGSAGIEEPAPAAQTP